MSNIWTAASEGDFARVQALVEGGMSPSIPDENTYTPLHAAASWGHPDILRYLVSKGGNINITDSDGETPLFVVENEEMAKLLVELGAEAAHRNLEGVSPSESLEEDHPEVAAYLRTLTGETLPSSSTSTGAPESTTSSTDATIASSSMTASNPPNPNPDLDEPTDELIQRVRVIMAASERGELTQQETDDKLREVVESSVLGTIAVGREIGESMEIDSGAVVRPRGEDANGDTIQEEDEEEVGTVKRRRDEAGR